MVIKILVIVSFIVWECKLVAIDLSRFSVPCFSKGNEKWELLSFLHSVNECMVHHHFTPLGHTWIELKSFWRWGESDNDNKAKQMVILRSWDPVCSARGCHGSIKWGDAKKLKGTHAIHDAIFKDCIKSLYSIIVWWNYRKMASLSPQKA